MNIFSLNLLLVISLASSLGFAQTSQAAPAIGKPVQMQAPSVSRLPLFYAPEANKVYVKTTVQEIRGQPRFYFEECSVNFVKFGGIQDLKLIYGYLNSGQAKCVRINQTTFNDNDMYAKVMLTQALALELDRELERGLRQSQDADVNFNVSAAQTTSTIASFAAGSLISAKWGFVYGFVAFIVTLNGIQMVRNYLRRHEPPPVLIDPDLTERDPNFYFDVELPHYLSPKIVSHLLTKVIDKATSYTYHVVNFQLQNASTSN